MRKSDLASLLKQFWLVLYWLAFACLAAEWAQSPGLILHSLPMPPYPWAGVVVTWVILAIEVWIFHVIFYRPAGKTRPLWTRLRNALLYAFGLCVFAFLTTVTDMPGYFYVNGYFALISFASLCIGALTFGLATLWQSRGSWSRPNQ